MIKVAVVDDHDIVRLGIRYMLKSSPGFSCVGELSGGAGAGKFVREVRPDVTLLDIKMPDVDGITALRDILAVVPDARVLVLTTSDVEEDIYQALELGAKGYMLKDSPPQEILEAIREVAAGGSVISPQVRSTYAMRADARGLTPRETDVMRLVARGFHNRDIGRMLSISENSVKMHLKHIFSKMEVADRAEAVAVALSRGIIAS